MNQPQVVGEIVAGILLGPSALGALWARATEVLFPSEIMPYLDLLANAGLILFISLVGLELDPRLSRGRDTPPSGSAARASPRHSFPGWPSPVIYGVRPFMQRLARYHEERGRLSAGILAALFVGIILSALMTDRIGIHVIFGALAALTRTPASISLYGWAPPRMLK